MQKPATVTAPDMGSVRDQVRPGLGGLAGSATLEAPEIASIGLTILGVLLIGLSLAFARLRLDDFGLAGSLSVVYHAGVAMLPLASGLLLVRERRVGPLLALQVALFVLVIWLTPLVLEGTPRFRTSYVSFSFLDPLLRGAGLDPTRLIYHNWPLFPLVMSAVVGALGVPGLTLMGWFPAMIVLAYLVPLAGLLHLVSRRVEPEPAAPTTEEVAERWHPRSGTRPRSGTGPRSWVVRGADAVGRGRAELGRLSPLAWAAGLWFFVVFDWTGQDYFSPQGLAYLLFLGWAVLLADVVLRHDGRFDLGSTALALALFTAIVLTHVLTAMLALGALIGLTVFRMARRPTLVITCALIFLAWNVYVAAPFYQANSDQIVSAVLSVGDFLGQNVTGRVNGTPQHQQVVLVRIAVALVAFALGALAAIVAWRRDRHWPRETRFAIALLLGIGIVAPVSVYGGEMLIRTLLFSLPMLAILIVRAIDVRLMRWALVAALAIAGPLQLITHYGNERYDYVSAGEIQGFQVIYRQLAPANIYGGYPGGEFQNVRNLDWRNAVVPAPRQPLTLADYEAPQNHRWAHRNWPIYVALSRGDAAAGELFYNQGALASEVRSLLETSPKYRLVYENPDIVIYRWLGPPPTPGK